MEATFVIEFVLRVVGYYNTIMRLEITIQIARKEEAIPKYRVCIVFFLSYSTRIEKTIFINLYFKI